MAIKKNGGDEFAAQESTESRGDTNIGAQSSTSNGRKPLTIAAIVGGGVLALGAAFGVGLIAGHAAPGFPGGGDFAAGAGPIGGHGDRDGDRGGHQGDGPKGQKEFRNGAPGQLNSGDAGGDFCHPGDGHTHDANGNDVAPSDAPEGFTCQTGPADGSGSIVPAPDVTTTP